MIDVRCLGCEAMVPGGEGPTLWGARAGFRPRSPNIAQWTCSGDVDSRVLQRSRARCLGKDVDGIVSKALRRSCKRSWAESSPTRRPPLKQRGSGLSLSWATSAMAASN